MKKIVILIIAASLLIVGFAMAYCPWDTETPSELSFGFQQADMQTAGTVTGIVGYKSFMSIQSGGTFNGITSQEKTMYGTGDLQLASTSSLTTDMILSQLAGRLGGGGMSISDSNYLFGCTATSNCSDENLTVTPYCDKITSSTSAFLTNGSFASDVTLMPIIPSGSITHLTAATGTGAVYGTAGMNTYQKCNETYQSIELTDKVKFVGSDIVFGREISLSSKR
jgi:hypothetical protein